MISNDKSWHRIQAFREISRQYKQIDSAGSYDNNVRGAITFEHPEMKLEYLQQYKFHLSFENSMIGGYNSEKLIHALAAGTVPIYSGAPDIADDFNPEAFINANDYQTFEQLIFRIREVDQNPEMYRKMINAPIFNQRWDTNEKRIAYLKDIVDKIVSLKKQ